MKNKTQKENRTHSTHAPRPPFSMYHFLFTSRTRSSERGFVILFAVLIAAIVLAITIGIANIAFKEIRLSSIARDSHLAFFAADSGAECALYHDLRLGLFDADTPPASVVINCDGISDVEAFQAIGSGNESIYQFVNSNFATGTFEISSVLPSGVTVQLCSSVTVKKHVPFVNRAGDSLLETQIDSFGYNGSCNTVGMSTDQRLVERHVYVHYTENLPNVIGP